MPGDAPSASPDGADEAADQNDQKQEEPGAADARVEEPSMSRWPLMAPRDITTHLTLVRDGYLLVPNGSGASRPGRTAMER